MNAADAKVKVALPGSNRRGRVINRKATAIALMVVALAGGWFVCERYRHSPLEDLPAVDLSQAPPAVKHAIEKARSAVIAHPRSGAAWGELGLFLRAHEFDAQANVCLAQAMRFDPREPLWPYTRAASLSVRDRAESIRNFEIVSRLRPDLALPHLRIAELQLEERHLDAAEAEYKLAFAIEPDNARAMLGLGLVAFARGDAAAARQWAEQSFARDPEQRTTAELLVRALHRLGEQEAAARQQAVLDRMPQGEVGWDDPFGEKVLRMRRDPGGLASRAQELLTLRRVPEAIEVLEQLVAAAPETTQWWVLLGKSLIRQGNLRRARQVLGAAVKRHPDSADLHFQSGVAHFLEKDWSAAAAEFRAAVRLKPDYSDAHYNLGHALKQLHDRDEAIGEFREAIRFRPDYAAAFTNLGELLLESGDREGALAALQTALQLNPADPQPKKLIDSLKSPPGTGPG